MNISRILGDVDWWFFHGYHAQFGKYPTYSSVFCKSNKYCRNRECKSIT